MSCPSNYTCSDMGLFLPIVNESDWSVGLRASLYLFGLLYCFMGVAIIADIFMCSIEVITSKTRTVAVASLEKPGGINQVEIRIWNPTVANLTLMALGSSAPEILMSLIEIVGNNFIAGELGPSTIVGSAAFNLLVITAICILSVPKGDVKRIKSLKVFALTSLFSMFAYVWLYIILGPSSENQVELWEAVVTFMMFPVLVLLAYIIDRNFCSKRSSVDVGSVTNLNIGGDDGVLSTTMDESRVNKKQVAEFMKDIGKHPDLSPEKAAKLLAMKVQESTPHERSWYRVSATRLMTGGRRVVPTVDDSLRNLYETVKKPDSRPTSPTPSVDMSGGGTRAVIEFSATSCAIMENEGRVRIGIVRYGRINTMVTFRYETLDGTAEAGSDYIPQKGTLVFEPMETYKYIDIEIIDDDEWEEDETFFVKLSINSESGAILGKKSVITVTIINDDEPGILEFTKPSYLFKESCGTSGIPVCRLNGTDGQISVSWKTIDVTAVEGKDYWGREGILIFDHGETEKTIDIPIIDDQEVEKDESFQVVLYNPTAGSQLGKRQSTVVTIVNDDEYNALLDRVVQIANIDLDRLNITKSTWATQFHDAMNVNGADLDGATTLDYIMHFITFGWKVLFALVPPPKIWGGWACFLMALFMIGALTAIISDLASIFGCLVNLEDSVTAITIVAIGTSLPDMFASRQATINEKYADSAVGNVTGSNSVNVFMGLGLSWLVATIYWTSKGEVFVVESGSLTFSVILYITTSGICLLTIVIRRVTPFFGNAELGGPTLPRILTAVFFISLWILYILLSALEAYGVINSI